MQNTQIENNIKIGFTATNNKLLLPEQLSLNSQNKPSRQLPCFTDVDNAINSLQDLGFITNDLRFTEKLKTQNDKPLWINNCLELDENFMLPIKKKIDLFLDEEIALFSRDFDSVKNPITPIDLGVKFTIREFLSIFPDVVVSSENTPKTKNLSKTLVGSGFDYFFYGLMRHLFNRIFCGNITLSDLFPSYYWEKLGSQIKEIPNDFDFRIYIKDLNHDQKEKILEKIDQFFVDKFEEAEKKNINRTKHSPLNEGPRIAKRWANQLLEKYGYRAANTDSPAFWTTFVRNMIYGNRTSPFSDRREGIGIVQFGNGKDRRLEFSFLDWVNRTSFSLPYCFEYDFGLNVVRMQEGLMNEFRYTPLDALLHKSLKIHRPLQTGRTIKELGFTKDWKMMISHSTKGRLCFGDGIEVDTYEAVIENYRQSIKQKKNKLAQEVFPEEFFLQLVDEVVKNQKKKKALYLPVAFNTVTLLPSKVDKKEKGELFQKIISKISMETLEKDSRLLVKALKKHSFDEVSAYLQLLGVISLLLTNGKCSRFKTVLWNKKEMLQVFLNHKAAFLLPLEIGLSFKLLIEKSSILGSEELTATLMELNVPLETALDYRQIIDEEVQSIKKLMEQSINAPVLYRALHTLLDSFNIPNTCSIENDLIMFPVMPHHKILWIFLKPLLNASPYNFSHNFIEKLSTFITNEDQSWRWREWVLALDEQGSQKEIVKKSLTSFLKDPKLTKKKEFFVKLFNSWKERKQWNTLCQFLNFKEVESCFSSSLMELFDLWFAAFNNIDKKNKKELLYISKKVAHLSANPQVTNKAQEISEKKRLNEIFFTLALNGGMKDHKRDVLSLAQLIFKCDISLWKDLFKEKEIPLNFQKDLWLDISDHSKSQEQITGFIEIALFLLENIHEEQFGVILSETNSKLLSETQTKKISEILKNKIDAKNIKQIISQAPIEEENKFNLLLNVLEKETEKTDKRPFFNTLKALYEKYGYLCFNPKYSSIIIELIRKNFSSLTVSQVHHLFSKYPSMRQQFLEKGMELLLEKLHENTDSLESKESLLQSVLLDKNPYFFEKISEWIDLVLLSFESRVKKMSSKNTTEFVQYIDLMVAALLEKNDLKSLQLLILTDASRLPIQLSESNINKLFDMLNSSKENLDKNNLYQVLSILSRMNHSLSEKKIGELSLYLFDYFINENVDHAEVIVDIILKHDPQLINNPNHPMINKWAVTMKTSKNGLSRSRWMEKILTLKCWEEVVFDYYHDILKMNKLKFFEELKKIEGEIHLRILNNSLNLLDSIGPDFCVEAMKYLALRKIDNKELWSSLLRRGLTLGDPKLFMATTNMIKENLELINYLQNSYDHALKDILIKHDNSTEQLFLIEKLFLSSPYLENLVAEDLLSIYEIGYKLLRKNEHKTSKFPFEIVQKHFLFTNPSDDEKERLDCLILERFVADFNNQNIKWPLKSITTFELNGLEESVDIISGLLSRKRNNNQKNCFEEKFISLFSNVCFCWDSFNLHHSVFLQKNKNFLKKINSLAQLIKQKKFSNVTSSQSLSEYYSNVFYVHLMAHTSNSKLLKEIETIIKSTEKKPKLTKLLENKIVHHFIEHIAHDENYSDFIFLNLEISDLSPAGFLECSMSYFESNKKGWEILTESTKSDQSYNIKKTTVEKWKKYVKKFFIALPAIYKDVKFDYLKVKFNEFANSVIYNSFLYEEELWLSDFVTKKIKKTCIEKDFIHSFVDHFVKEFRLFVEEPQIIENSNLLSNSLQSQSAFNVFIGDFCDPNNERILTEQNTARFVLCMKDVISWIIYFFTSKLNDKLPECAKDFPRLMDELFFIQSKLNLWGALPKYTLALKNIFIHFEQLVTSKKIRLDKMKYLGGLLKNFSLESCDVFNNVFTNFETKRNAKEIFNALNNDHSTMFDCLKNRINLFKITVYWSKLLKIQGQVSFGLSSEKQIKLNNHLEKYLNFLNTFEVIELFVRFAVDSNNRKFFTNLRRIEFCEKTLDLLVATTSWVSNEAFSHDEKKIADTKLKKLIIFYQNALQPFILFLESQESKFSEEEKNSIKTILKGIEVLEKYEKVFEKTKEKLNSYLNSTLSK